MLQVSKSNLTNPTHDMKPLLIFFIPGKSRRGYLRAVLYPNQTWCHRQYEKKKREEKKLNSNVTKIS